MLDLRLLQQALTLAQSRTFARAAEALHLTQPALSRSIAGLEASLGERLFNRTAQGVTPTAFGQLLLARAERLLAESRELERDFRLLRGLDVGELRVGVGPFPAAISAGRAVAQLLTAHPRLAIDLVQDDIRDMAEAVQRSELDLAVIELSIVDDMPDLATEALPQHPGFFVCRAGHALAALTTPTIGDIMRYPLVTNRLVARFDKLMGQGVRRAEGGGFLPQVKIASTRLAIDIVLRSDAVALATLSTVAEEVAAGRLAVLRPRLPGLHSGYGFVYRRDRELAPAAVAFMAAMRRVEADVSAQEAALPSAAPRRPRAAKGNGKPTRPATTAARSPRPRAATRQRA